MSYNNKIGLSQLQTVDLSANALRGQIVAESTSVNLKLVCNYH